MSDFIGTKLTMNLGERSYDIILKNGALENLYQFARLDRKVAVVTMNLTFLPMPLNALTIQI